jgi:hypothetical protein
MISDGFSVSMMDSKSRIGSTIGVMEPFITEAKKAASPAFDVKQSNERSRCIIFTKQFFN